jgi:hypothetical protein
MFKTSQIICFLALVYMLNRESMEPSMIKEDICNNQV